MRGLLPATLYTGGLPSGAPESGGRDGAARSGRLDAGGCGRLRRPGLEDRRRLHHVERELQRGIGGGGGRAPGGGGGGGGGPPRPPPGGGPAPGAAPPPRRGA